MNRYYTTEIQFFHIICRGTLILTHLFPMHPFSNLWKHQKTVRFSDVFRGFEERSIGNKWVKCEIFSWSFLWSSRIFLESHKNEKWLFLFHTLKIQNFLHVQLFVWITLCQVPNLYKDILNILENLRYWMKQWDMS